MSKTIQEQIAEMEARCTQLEELQKLFEKAVKKRVWNRRKKNSQTPGKCQRHFNRFW